MSFQNGAIGKLKYTLMLDRTGSAIDSAIQFADSLETGSRLYLVISPDLTGSFQDLLTAVSLSTHKYPPFDNPESLRPQAFRGLLEDRFHYQSNWAGLVRTICPTHLYNKKIFFKVLNPYDSAYKLQTTSPNKRSTKKTDQYPVGDHFFIPCNSRSRTIYCKNPILIPILRDFLKPLKLNIEPFRFPINILNGDLIAGENFLFVGHSSYRNFCNNTIGATTEQAFKAGVKKLYYRGQKLHTFEIIGYKDDRFSDEQFYHLDLYLTYAGKSKKGKHLLFVGYIPDSYISYLEVHNIVAPEEIVLLRKQQKVLNDIHNQLLTINPKHFDIKQLPLIKINQIVFSLNNAIVECIGRKQKIYIPRYMGMSAGIVDPRHASLAQELLNINFRSVKHLLEQEDFHVIPVDTDYFENDLKSYALHCVTAILQRV